MSSNKQRHYSVPHPLHVNLKPESPCSPTTSSLTTAEVESYLKSHSEFAKQYYLANEDSLSLHRTHRTRRIFSLRKGRPRWANVQQPTTDAVNHYYDDGASSPLSEASESTYFKTLGTLPEQDLLMELVKDIASNLDLVILCTKIMRNVSPLMKADRCSLFLVEGSDVSKKLVSKVFDLSEGPHTPSTYQSDPSFPEVTIEWGTGIMGHVARTGEVVSIPDAYAYPNFNKDVDDRTGYRTQSVLCMPVKIYPADKKEGVIIGVAMAINKKDQNAIIPFSQEDEEIFAKFLAFCGIGIRNAQRFERVKEEEEFKHNLLNMAELLYDDFSSMDTFAKKIMEVGYTMLECERCSVYVLAPRTEANDDIRFNEVYTSEPNVSHYSSPPEREGEMIRSKSRVSMKTLSSQDYTTHKSGLVYDVALTGKKKNLNLKDSSLSEANLALDNLAHEDFNVLMMPICCKDKEIVGVAQFVNRTDKKPFTDADEATFAAFAIFCGLGIKHINDYDKARTLLAQQNVTIEQLTYHIVASEDEVEKLAKQVVPNAFAMELGDYDFYFPDEDENSIIYAVSMFQYLGLIKKFSIDHRCLIKFLLTLRKNYRPVLYHNWGHAFHVANSIFVFFESGGMSANFTDLEKLALMIASFAHDVDHRGTNNKYQQEFDTPLYNLYNTSTMEHHHYKHCALILQCEGHQILSGLTKEQYTTILNLIQQAILATDLSVYFEQRGEFFRLVKEQKFDGLNSRHKQLLMSILMTAADLSSITKPWPVQYEVAHKVAEEFWQQGDIERAKLGHEPHPIMDRHKQADLPKMQVGFIDGICKPVYEHLSQLNPRLEPLLEGCIRNRSKWVQLDHEHSRNSLSQRINEDSRHW